MRKLVINIALICVLVLGTAVPVMAYTLPNAATPASLTIVMNLNGKAVSGGNVTLYKTGEIDTRAKSYTFVPTEAFKNSGIPINEIESSTVATQLAEYARKNSIAGINKSVGDSGTVRFDNLTPGLYMITQEVAAEGYEKMTPFQVAVPHMNEEGFDYDLEAYPKVVILSHENGDVTYDEEFEGNNEPPSDNPENTGDEDGKTGDEDGEMGTGTLPQTGQLKWPVPVLSVLGMVMFALGWYIRNAGRRGRYEK